MSEALPAPAALVPASKTEPERELSKLALAALGIVYGDIGTSPLYAMRECFTLPHGVAVTRANVLGVESLVFWSLTLVISLKYLTFIVRADNQGQGGILALLALLQAKPNEGRKRAMAAYVLLALAGAALLYGDGAITPAISVLAAIEGLGTTTSSLTPPVITGLALVLLAAIFLLQRARAAGVGAAFGPAILVWFVTIGAMGVYWIAKRPEVLLAVDPRHAVRFFAAHRLHGFLVLGFVFLCVTGGEALYADVGRFGKAPIRAAWFGIVFPALLANYFGQGALLLATGPVRNPFFEMVSGVWRYGLVAIAVAAAVVASQAIISGCSALTQQAVQLGYLPRVKIEHTSGTAEMQIYVPATSLHLMAGAMALVLAFQGSSRLASAYGVAVAGTMSITSLLFFGVARRWGWSPLAAGALVALFLAFDLSFLGANLHKISAGGWISVVVGVVMFTLMTTWRRGRELRADALRERALPLDTFMADLALTRPYRVPGAAVYVTSNVDRAPLALLHCFKHIKGIHEQVLLLSIATGHVPRVPRAELVRKVDDLGQGFYRIRAQYGFMQNPNVLELLDVCAERGLEIRRADTSFFLGRQTLVASRGKGMAEWRKELFAFMSRNARPAYAFFQIPPNRVVELGAQVEI